MAAPTHPLARGPDHLMTKRAPDERPVGGRAEAAQAPPGGIVTLLTDFGRQDPFVGVMQGVLLAVAPRARLIDLTHEVPPQAVEVGAFWLQRCSRYFAAGTVHLAVVDPGVGTARRALALAAQGHFFVGPDNGLFTDVLPAADAVYAIDADAMRRRVLAELPGADPSSTTFHGRDVFAPAAALLASGAGLDAVGAPLAGPAPTLLPDPGEPRVMIVDRFGNLITNVECPADGAPPQISIRGRRLRVVRTYGEAAHGECVALRGSFGTLEIAVRDGSAARELGVGRGEAVALH